MNDELKQEIISKVLLDIETYSSNLKNVIIDVLDMEWDIFFNEIYELLAKKKMENSYYGILEAMVGDMFLNIQYETLEVVNGFSNIERKHIMNLYNLVRSLSILRLFSISSVEVELLGQKILSKCSWGNVINIIDYQKKKKY